MDSNTIQRRFISRPANCVVGTLAGVEPADAAVNALVEAGFDRQCIDILHGEEDPSRLDPAGTEHELLERLRRALIRTGGPVEEYTHLAHHVDDLRAGRFVIMILAPERERRTIAADILAAHGAEFVGFYGRWAGQGLTPDSGVTGIASATDAHAYAGRPEDIPRLFVEAWNKRDLDALASILDSDAEFVNITGLWWHDRAAIRKAHAYGLERTFDASTLTVDELRLKRLSDDLAIVYAALTLSDQTPLAAITQPQGRKTIFSFVVRRVAGRWMCASAHNTDVVPNMEARVIDDGALWAAKYRSDHVH
jgi:uncharacterized protein (TIGR02246 family)